VRRALAVLGFVALGCSGPAPPERPRDLVLLVVDTLRADRVGWYGSEAAVTPALDCLVGERGVVFWNAFAQAPLTAPSMASLFTSRLPSQHGVRQGDGSLVDAELTLAEVLADAGWATAGFSANGVMVAGRGFSQGFEAYDCDLPVPFTKRRGDALNRAALAWLDEVLAQPDRPPFFLYLQYLEPHVPFTVDPEVLARVMRRRGRSEIDAVHANLLLDPKLGRASYGLGGAGKASGQERLALTDLYDAEVMSVDLEVSMLVAGLVVRGLLDDAIVVITADHGEELFEHGRMGHGASLHDEVVRVPLAILVPGRTTRADVRAVVSSIDVAPTLLELVGVPVPERFEGRSFGALLDQAGGRSWLPWSAGESDVERAAFVELDREESPHRRAAITRDAKLIETRDGARSLWRLDDDGVERAASAGAADAAVERALADGRALADSKRTNAPPARLTADERERLRALGYLEE